MKMRLLALVLAFLLLSGCALFENKESKISPTPSEPGATEESLPEDPAETPELPEAPTESPTPAGSALTDAEGDTVGTRFLVPEGFTRVEVTKGSFADYLREYPLRPDGESVYLFDGTVNADAHAAAVVKMDIPNRDIMQTTRILIRLRAEYLYNKAQFAAISFHFLSGFEFSFEKWGQGWRLKEEEGQAEWVETEREPDTSKEALTKYLEKLYAYSNGAALKTDMRESGTPEIGGVFLKNGGAIIADMAKNEAGDIAVLLLRGGEATQDGCIVGNPNEGSVSPWYIIPVNGIIKIPGAEFSVGDLMRFALGE